MPSTHKRKPAPSAKPVAKQSGAPGTPTDAVQFLSKKLGADIFATDKPLVGISNGCVAVDHVLGNDGFPRGRVGEVYGLESSGKSTLCMTACAKAQSLGLNPVYIDVERSLTKTHADRLGFDVTKPGVWIKPKTFEDTLTVIDTMAQKGGADIIFVDSVPALVTEAVMKGDVGTGGQFGEAARMFAASLPRLIQILEERNTALIFVNQLRTNIEMDAYRARFAPKHKTYGGFALRYYCSTRLELTLKKKKATTRTVPSPTEVGKDIELDVASQHEALVVKSKVSQPFQRIEFFIRYDSIADIWGIDNLQTRLDIARVKGVIQVKSGGYFTFTKANGAEEIVQGESSLYDWFLERPDEIAHLKARIGV